MSEIDDLLADDDDYEGDEDELMADDDDYEGEDELMADDDDDEVGARRRRRSRRRSRRRPSRRRARKVKTQNQLLVFPRTAVAAGATSTIPVQVDRDCRPLDLRVEGSVLATGVDDPGITVDDLEVHGKNLFASSGAVLARHFAPEGRQASGSYNCDVQELIRSGETIRLTVTNVTAGAISVSGTLLARASIK